MAHDFMTEQPVKDADVYFLRWILHDWSDKYAVKILRSLVPALKPGARVVVMDAVLPPPGVLPQWQEDKIRNLDVGMTALFNSHERELDDWSQLFQHADHRFDFKGGKQPPGSNLWVLVAEWKP